MSRGGRGRRLISFKSLEGFGRKDGLGMVWSSEEMCGAERWDMITCMAVVRVAV
jgi:hypothetical protein